MEEQAQRIEKPWGFELLFACTQRYAGKVIFVKKGHRLSLQYHARKEESIYIHEGKALVEIEESPGRMVSTIVESGCCIRVPPCTRHRLEAVEDTTLFEVSTPELDDIIRLEDDYGRAGR